MLIVPASIGLFGDGFPSTTTTASVIKSALMFDGSNDRLQLKFDEAGNTAKWTLSVWAKRAETSDASVVIEARADGNNTGTLYFNTTDIHWQDYDDGVGTPAWRLNSDNMYRDTTAWMHIVLVNDTENGTAGDRQRIYVNGTRITSFSTETNSGQGYESAQGINSTNPHYIGFDGNTEDYSGYLAEFIFLDGVATTDAGSFGADDDNGVWGPKDPSNAENIADWGGKNSFWLKFDDGDNIGKNSRPTTVSAVEGTYKIDKSLMLDGGADYLIRDPSTAGNRRTFTFSCWLKRSAIGSQGGTTGNNIFGGDRTGSYSDRLMFGTADDGNDYIEASFHDGSSGTCKTSALYRDPTAWMHVLWVVDTTQATASNRVKIYVNGVEAALNSPTYPAQNYDTNINYTENQVIGARPGNLSHQHFGGYLADVILLDGTAVSDASDFGGWDTNGNWVPVDPATKVAASAGTNGFHLKFDASGLLGKSSISSTNPSVSHLGSSTNGSTSTAYTFSSSSLGDAASNRTIVIAVGGGRATSGDRSVSTLTVGGSSATFIARKNSGAGNVVEFWSIAVSSGTSADIVVTFSASMVAAGISWWRVLDAGNPISTDSNTASGWTTQAVTTIGQTGDVAFYAIYDEGDADAYAWSDATERSEHIDIVSSRSWTSADYTFDAAESHAETATISGGSGNDNGFLGVTFSNNNSFASNSLAAANQVEDSPTNTSGDNEGNYNLPNPLDAGTSTRFASGNQDVDSSGGGNSPFACTMAVTSGKYYWEVDLDSSGFNDGSVAVGIAHASTVYPGTSHFFGNLATEEGWYAVGGSGVLRNNSSTTAYGTDASSGSTLMMALDMDNAKMWWGLDGTWFTNSGVGNPATGANAAPTSMSLAVPIKCAASAQSGDTLFHKFRPEQWDHTAPTGFKAWNTANLAETTVTDPRAHYANALYTGTAQSKTVRSCFDSTGTAWTPDFVWIKGRSHSGEHVLVDSVRGAANVLTPDSAAAEFHDIKAVTSLIEGGFTLGAGDDRNDSNDNAKTYVAWCMKAGGVPTVENDNTSSAMDDGSVFKGGVVQSSYTPSGSPSNYPQKMSIASHGGFSIVKYTGTGANATVPHGLSRTPTFFMLKPMTQAHSWAGYHSAYGTGSGNDKVFRWDTNHQGGDQAGDAWQNNPFANAHTITFGSQTGQNENNIPHIMYTWARTPGMIGIGSYTGNASTDGTYVVVDDGAFGFRPAWLMIKNIAAAGNWFMYDAARNPHNVVNKYLIADNTAAEATSGPVQCDFTSNGFKLRSTNDGTNSGTYVYLAFADQPFNLARAR